VLAPDLRSNGPLKPCAVLRRLIVPPAAGFRAAPDRIGRTAALAAAYLRLGEAVLEDLGQPVAVPGRRRWKATCDRLPRLVAAGRLELKRAEPVRPPRIALATHAFLASLPVEFVRTLVAWAPPIVIGNPDEERALPVIGNVLSAFIARHRIPDEPVCCRVLGVSTFPRFGLVEMAAVAVEVLPIICDGYRDQVIREAENLQLAQALSGLARSTCAGIRQRSAEPAP
jgi:hypothetical protein